MKVVQLSTYESQGGAARATLRLHRGLVQRGVSSTLFVCKQSSADASVVEYRLSFSIYNRLLRLVRRHNLEALTKQYRTTRPSGLDIFSSIGSEFGIDPMNQIPNCDVLNAHWISGFIDYTIFARPRLQNIPLVFTLHDMNAFTGGCHYAGKCTRFTESCGMCPQLGSSLHKDLSSSTLIAKSKTLEKRGENTVKVVAPSNWLANEARKSSVFSRFDVTTIPYGLDTRAFAPRDRVAARKILDLPLDQQIILFAADSISNPRKGFEYLNKALSELSSSGRLLLSFGRDAADSGGRWPHIHLGPVSDDRFLSLIYSAADVFVIPSIEENLALTGIEAMACGLPSVGFRIGGIQDIIVDSETGYLVPLGDISALKASIQRILEDDDLRSRMSVASRRIATAKFSLHLQADQYRNVYDSFSPFFRTK